MVRNHVAQRPGRLVELAALLHPDSFGRRDLHMIDPITVPDRFEQAVGEAERQDVLDGVLTEEMVDAENLVLVQGAQDARIQFARRFEAVPERLLDHDPAPGFLGASGLGLIGKSGFAELLHHDAEKLIRDGEIEDHIAGDAGFAEGGAQVRVERGVGRIARYVRHVRREPRPGRCVEMVDIERGARVADIALQRSMEIVAPALCGFVLRATPISANCSGSALVRDRL